MTNSQIDKLITDALIATREAFRDEREKDAVGIYRTTCMELLGELVKRLPRSPE